MEKVHNSLFWGGITQYASLATSFDCEWLMPGIPLPQGAVWPRATAIPVPGSLQLIHATNGRHTAQGSHWLLFVPGAASLNGWDSIEDFVGSAFVLVRIVRLEDETSGGGAWLRIVVLEVIPFAELDRRFPPHHVESLDLGVRGGARVRQKDWELVWAPQDDAGFWMIIRNKDNGPHIVAWGEWLSGDRGNDRSWGGNLHVTNIR